MNVGKFYIVYVNICGKRKLSSKMLMYVNQGPMQMDLFCAKGGGKSNYNVPLISCPNGVIKITEPLL